MIRDYLQLQDKTHFHFSIVDVWLEVVRSNVLFLIIFVFVNHK